MAVRTCVGLTKKVGHENYASLGATCTIDSEVVSSTLHNPATVEDEIRRLCGIAWQAVNAGLSRYDARQQHNAAHLNGHATTNGASPCRATSKQLDYAKQTAKSIPGHGVRWHGIAR